MRGRSGLWKASLSLSSVPLCLERLTEEEWRRLLGSRFEALTNRRPRAEGAVAAEAAADLVEAQITRIFRRFFSKIFHTFDCVSNEMKKKNYIDDIMLFPPP